MASDVAARDLTDVSRQFKIAFFGGEQRMHTSMQIIGYLNHLSEHIKSSEKIDLEPPYFNELVEIVNRIVLNSRHASYQTILNIVDELAPAFFGRLNLLERERESDLAIEYRQRADLYFKQNNISHNYQDHQQAWVIESCSYSISDK